MNIPTVILILKIFVSTILRNIYTLGVHRRINFIFTTFSVHETFPYLSSTSLVFNFPICLSMVFWTNCSLDPDKHWYNSKHNWADLPEYCDVINAPSLVQNKLQGLVLCVSCTAFKFKIDNMVSEFQLSSLLLLLSEMCDCFYI